MNSFYSLVDNTHTVIMNGIAKDFKMPILLPILLYNESTDLTSLVAVFKKCLDDVWALSRYGHTQRPAA